MIDIHSHILYGVDDGCKTIECSIDLIRSAIESGIDEIILTPHYSPSRGHTTNHKIIESNFNKLTEEIKKQKLNITLQLGKEIDNLPDLKFHLETKPYMTLNNSKYILLDFGMNKTDIDEYNYEVLLNGYIPIIAHCERYDYIRNFEFFKTYKKTGALIQVNAKSICKPRNNAMRKKIKYLFKNNLVDFISSDCHSSKDNYSYLEKAREMIRSKYPKFIEKSI